MEHAIKHYRLALKVRTRHGFPEKWAETHNNLGIAYKIRIKGDRAENVEQAIAHFELALEVSTRDGFPEKWADIQNNLGGAYCTRIKGGGAENMERAIKAVSAERGHDPRPTPR